MRVLITRPRAQSAAFGESMRKAGLEPVFFPVIEIRPLEDLRALDEALERIERYAWVVFTSVNGVETVLEHCRKSGRTLPFPAALKIAAIGPKTADAVRAAGFEPAYVPEEFVAEALLPGLGELKGKRVLLPRAEIARKALPEAIRAAGGKADEIAVYSTLPAEPDPEGLAALRSGVDWITFTSPSTVQNFTRIARQEGLDPLHLPGAPRFACIGPITAKAAREEGFHASATAAEYTGEGLIQAILVAAG